VKVIELQTVGEAGVNAGLGCPFESGFAKVIVQAGVVAQTVFDAAPSVPQPLTAFTE